MFYFNHIQFYIFKKLFLYSNRIRLCKESKAGLKLKYKASPPLKDYSIPAVF